MNYQDLDKSTLTDLQRRNAAAWMLKQYEIKQQFGDKVQIVDSLEDVLRMSHPLTVPVSAIDTDKQLSIIMEEMREYPDGTVSLIHERGSAPVASTVSDVTLELERQVAVWQQIEQARSKKRHKTSEFRIPEGYKLVKVDDNEPVSAATKVVADILTGTDNMAEAKDTIGVAIPNDQETKMSRSEAAKALLDLLM